MTSLRVDPKNINNAMTTDAELAAGLALKYDASNPSGFETPTQLTARDTNNRARGNHTGTQLASTISDFAASVRGTILSGLSTATATVALATDNILTAIGKLQGQISANTTQITTNTNSITASNVTTAPQDTGIANSAGTSTAHARADHVHNTVVTTARITGLTGSNTSGTTYTAIASFSITPPAGSYVFDYNLVVSATLNNATINASVFKNGTQITDSEMTIMVRSGARDMISGGTSVQTANGTDVFDVRVSTSGGTTTTLNRIFKSLRVG